MRNICYACGNEYQQVGQHWLYNPEHRPSFSDKQREIITGLVMGDGYIDNRHKNPKLIVKMISKEYLEYLDDIFSSLGSGVRLQKTSEECAKLNNSNPEDYNAIYKWATTSHPEMEMWYEWYKSGNKVFPEKIELTPETLTHWYVGDGHYNKKLNRIELTVTNEKGNKEKLQSYFKSQGLPEGSWYENNKKGETRMYWNEQNTKVLFEYMNKPLPSFDYKWDESFK